jgi:cell division protein FtsB
LEISQLERINQHSAELKRLSKEIDQLSKEISSLTSDLSLSGSLETMEDLQAKYEGAENERHNCK